MKVVRDLWGNKTRTLLVVLSIATGVFAIGVIASTREILQRDMREGYAATRPASASLYTEPFDDELVQVVRAMPGVVEAEGRRSLVVRVSAGPDEWRNLELNVIADFDDMRVHTLRPEDGEFPPPAHELLVERASMEYLGAQIGDSLLIETPDGKQRRMRVAGTVHDLSVPEGSLVRFAFGYITLDTVEWLGESRSFNELRIVVDGDGQDREYNRLVAERVRDKVEKSGRAVFGMRVPTPGQHWADEIVEPLLLLLGVLGALSLLLSGFLVINTISAVLTQQVRQIGVMKAVGARNGQIAGLYLSMVFLFGVFALTIAVPLGALGARELTKFAAGVLNVDITNFGIPARVLVLEVATALLVPLLAALWPVISGVRITVREALGSQGVGSGGFGESFFDRLLGRVRGLSRPQLISLRNTFRRRARLMLTLTTLTLAGAALIAVFSVQASLQRTLDDLYQTYRLDIWVNFNRGYRIKQIEQEVLAVPGVSRVESWGFVTARRIRPDGSKSPGIAVEAPQVDSDLFRPTVIAGRWLLPEDENAVVVTADLLKEEPDIWVGDTIVLEVNGRELPWRVVGVAQVLFAGNRVYANYPYVARVTGSVGRAGVALVVTEQHDGAFQAEVAKRLEEHLKQRGLRVSSTLTMADDRETAESQFNILIAFLGIMAGLLGVVGGLGLMGTMSINVLERTREIGVLRAIGASDGAVLRIVLLEGVVIGVLSWAVGAMLAFPLGKILSDQVGLAFLRTPLSHSYSVGGAFVWLGLVVVLALLASFLPAWNASRLTVRDVLTYE